jgi:hypothetical protein
MNVKHISYRYYVTKSKFPYLINKFILKIM